MNQQRARRFRSAEEAAQLKAEALSKGLEVNEDRFDSNCITPGMLLRTKVGGRGLGDRNTRWLCRHGVHGAAVCAAAVFRCAEDDIGRAVAVSQGHFLGPRGIGCIVSLEVPVYSCYRLNC